MAEAADLLMSSKPGVALELNFADYQNNSNASNYLDDFGAPPSGWTPTTLVFMTDSEAPQGTKMRMNASLRPDQSYGNGFLWKAIRADFLAADFEIYTVSQHYYTASSRYFGVDVGDNATLLTGQQRFGNFANYLSVSTRIDDFDQAVAQTSAFQNWTAGAWYNYLLSRVDNTFTLKRWDRGSAENTAVVLTWVDNSNRFSSVLNGLSVSTGSNPNEGLFLGALSFGSYGRPAHRI